MNHSPKLQIRELLERLRSRKITVEEFGSCLDRLFNKLEAVDQKANENQIISFVNEIETILHGLRAEDQHEAACRVGERACEYVDRVQVDGYYVIREALYEFDTKGVVQNTRCSQCGDCLVVERISDSTLRHYCGCGKYNGTIRGL